MKKFLRISIALLVVLFFGLLIKFAVFNEGDSVPMAPGPIGTTTNSYTPKEV